MNKMKKNLFYVIIVGVVFSVLTLFAWLKPTDKFSATERRELAAFPQISFQSLKTGLFMSKFETYTLDQFPLRENFRSLKALFHKYVLIQSDNNGVYMQDGYISKIDYPYNPKAVQNAIRKFSGIYNKYISGSDAKVYCALIPDKNYFLAEKNGYPSIDYDSLYSDFKNGISDSMTYIEIKDLLEIEDYYLTDTHWRQEKIADTAKYIAECMGTALNETYQTVTLDTPFYGVYYGQLALPTDADKISYLDNGLFESCTVYDHQNNREIPVYDISLAGGRDPYEMFLSGSLTAITIENPNASSEKELVVFRDSFGSSICPLFAEGYSKITILDIRYLYEGLIGNFVEFSNQDVLFLYSTSVINNESAFN